MPAFIDFETRSVADLRQVGLYNYARHPSTDVWFLCHGLDDGAIETWRPGDPVPAWAFTDCEIVAHNAPFEAAIWTHILTPRYGWPALDPARLICTMARCYAMALPGGLGGALAALGVDVQKDAQGHALMLRMCRPRSIAEDGTPVWWDEAEKLERLRQYCITDVEGERRLYGLLFPLGESEARIWQMDYRINQRGVRVDRGSIVAALEAVKGAKNYLDIDMKRVTGGAVKKCSEIGALKEWCAAQGVPVEGLAKADIVDLLDGELPDTVAEALLLRQEAGKSSTSKLETMLLLAAEDDRVRNMFQYYGAATGRWAGRGIQPHNFPRDVPKAVVIEKLFKLFRDGEGRMVDMIHGSVMKIISQCLRGFMLPAEGHAYLQADYAGVEARGVAWFCGEQWKLDAFRAADAKTGPGIYELAYAKMFHVPVGSVLDPSPERQIGKVVELAMPYGGGKGAFHTMGRAYGVNVSDAKADEFKTLWRGSHPATKATWRELENAAIMAVQDPGVPYKAGYAGRHVTYKKVGTFLWCLLPSGRALCYAYPKIIDGLYGPQLTYFTVPSTNDIKRGKIIDDPANTSKWARIATYGGSLLENIIQAICRDLLADAMLRLEAAGIPIALHVHDEVVGEVLRELAEELRAKMHEIMNSASSWAKDFPLTAKCVVMTRYGKG
jgi:DNA polymerase